MSPTDGDGLNGQASAQRAFGMDSAGLASVPSSIMAEAYAVPDSPVFTASIVEIIPWYKQKRYVCIFLMIAMIMLIGVVAAAVRLPVGGKQPSIVYVNVTDGPTETVLDNVTDGPTESLPAWIDGNYQATAGNGLDLAKFNRIKDRILERGISHVATLESPISPQYKALRWIVRDDKRQFDLTTQDDESNTIAENEIDDERALFQRYALAVLWHQTNDLQVVRESLSGEEIANVFDEGYTPVALTKEDIEWNQSTNWMSEKGLCLWHGVTCHPHEQLGEKFDGDFYVAILNITSNNIHGILPREVYTAFNRMVALDVSKNRFAGPIAGDIGMLSELQDLLLFENGFSGNIPQEIGQLSNLFNLYLNDNKFMGQLPSQLGTMWKLRGVSMFNNSLDGRVPPGLGNLKNLIALYLDTNKFTGQIPKSFGGMTGMIDLRLRQNDFSGSVPSELGELKQLETLYLDTNPRIKGSIPSELGGLVKLSELHLYQMNLNGKLPSELGLLEGLVYLYLDSNELTGNIPEEWGGMRDLEELFLTGNNLVGPLPQTIRGMKNLKTLRAADNDLAGPLPADLSKLMKLEYVYLDNNDFSGAIPTELGLLKKLKTMHLHSSKLTGEMPQEVCSLKTEYLLQDLRVDCDEVACTCCTCDE
ncbi:hypothetical protein THAOC_37900 [Thalassiosira oceanica]|uniref:Leucine-rich repeat-containing N-terminal plant-type domain-containing protein n=1 Tax=Thalassiosira oceanica TaxID=159749 RepID=K0RAX8_THAOC|nr:hypothetical protein THAOC_37900 [Thalassiosira oceanica]|eukprot:EJK43637.1 hypothetical protein THAOC_37900 [Thalassiosira oceanica]